MPRITRVTLILLVTYVAFSLGRVILAAWAGTVDIVHYLALNPDKVLHGQLWRLFTYPFFSMPFMGPVIGFLFGGVVLYFIAQPLESMWGSKRLARRTVALVVVPAALTVLLSLAVGQIRFHEFAGLDPLIDAMFVAFGAALGPQRVQIWPLPWAIKGDHLIAFAGGFILLNVLFAAAILPFMPDVFAFGFALAWLRMDLSRDLKRSWLKYKKGQVEAKLSRLKQQRNFRVIRPDDDEDEPKKPYLN